MASGIDIEGVVFDARSSNAILHGSNVQSDDPRDRAVAATLQEDDLALDRSLRPKYLKDYLGQVKIKESLAILIEAAKARGETFSRMMRPISSCYANSGEMTVRVDDKDAAIERVIGQ